MCFMDKFLIVIFACESQAFEGLWSLQDLQHEGRIHLYAVSVIARDASGKVVVKQPGDIGPIGTGVGLLTWSLNNLFHRVQQARDKREDRFLAGAGR